jgi:hypothetical protein
VSRVLSRTVAVKGIDMALIQESWICEGRIMGLNIPGYTLFCGSGTDRLRTCILAKNRDIWMLPGFSFRDLVAVQMKYDEGEDERSVVVCSVYLSFGSKDLRPTREFVELMQYCEEKTLSLIVGCDSNCHHTVWGSANYNDRGVALVEFLNSTNLEILNRGNEPTFCNSRRVEVLNITLGSCELLERIKDWEVSSEPSLSDHRHIMFKLVGSVPASFFRDLKITNWDSFWEDLEGRLEQGPKIDEAGLGLAIAFFQGALITAYEDNCPFKVGRKGKFSLRWMSTLESLRREVRRLFNKGRRSGTAQSWELYKKVQRRYKEEVRKASRDLWRAFCNSINDLPMSARLYRAPSRDLKAKLSSLVAPSGLQTQSEGQTLELLMTTHSLDSKLFRRW